MPRIMWRMLASTIALGVSACTQPTPSTTASTPTPAQTGSQQMPPPRGGVTFTEGSGPGQVQAPPVTAYTGSQRGST